jgi:hypothetical protein
MDDEGLELQSLEGGRTSTALKLQPRFNTENKSSARARRSSAAVQREVYHGRVLSWGIVIFMAGFVINAVWTWWLTDKTSFGWSWIVYAVLQTAGLIGMTTADIDMDAYFQRNQWQVLVFVMMWMTMTAMTALMVNSGPSQCYWVEAVPFLYLLCRFKEVMERRAPLHFSQLFTLSLAMAEFGNALNYICLKWYAIGAYTMIGSFIIPFAYKLSSLKTDSLTMRFYLSAYMVSRIQV